MAIIGGRSEKRIRPSLYICRIYECSKGEGLQIPNAPQ